MEKSLQELETSITSKQTELEMMRGEGNLEAVAEIEKEIDELQKQFTRLKNSVGAGSYRYEDKVSVPKAVLPEIDQQIAYIESVCRGQGVETSIEMMQAILGSLRAAKLFGTVDPLGEPDAVIRTIERPYNLDAQEKFVDELKSRLPARGTEAQRDLYKMYDSIIQNLYVARWVGKAAADALLDLPSNKPTFNINDHKKSSFDISVVKDDSGEQKWTAVFNDDEGLKGYGMTEQESVLNLFKGREKKLQAELFGKEDIDEK